MIAMLLVHEEDDLAPGPSCLASGAPDLSSQPRRPLIPRARSALSELWRMNCDSAW